MIRLLATAAALAIAAPAAAQEGPALSFTLKGGVTAAPEYFGADDVEAGPLLGFSLQAARLGPLEFGNPDPLYRPQGFGVIGSVRYIGERTAGDADELAGTDDVDATLELGAGLRYATDDWQAYGALRYGIGGHETWVGELGADVFARPTDRLTLRAGPRALFGTDDYAATYFGVTAAESAASGLAAFDPDGGLISTGAEFGAGYRLGGGWGIDAAIRYERLRGDAKDSPITLDDEQVSASIGVTRRFTFGF
ncbi:MipA/OmpV family protein [Jannaschia sp. Os4]|uniref:MipA/OmpV family protein n=1 Tax=Jannaschia sp. Os4 TaxID=2807617 RepID=UPI00193A211F|nr:MipA/OmpV family protein [Jannaschia sp. Os4]MBM2577374.1 MipA/OmpV family protein [Jannaschia sp. Os4]